MSTEQERKDVRVLSYTMMLGVYLIGLFAFQLAIPVIYRLLEFYPVNPSIIVGGYMGLFVLGHFAVLLYVRLTTERFEIAWKKEHGDSSKHGD